MTFWPWHRKSWKLVRPAWTADVDYPRTEDIDFRDDEAFEATHPRQPKGMPEGGEFVGGAVGPLPTATFTHTAGGVKKLQAAAQAGLASQAAAQLAAQTIIGTAQEYSHSAIAGHGNKLLAHLEQAHGLPKGSLGTAYPKGKGPGQKEVTETIGTVEEKFPPGPEPPPQPTALEEMSAALAGVPMPEEPAAPPEIAGGLPKEPPKSLDAIGKQIHETTYHSLQAGEDPEDIATWVKEAYWTSDQTKQNGLYANAMLAHIEQTHGMPEGWLGRVGWKEEAGAPEPAPATGYGTGEPVTPTHEAEVPKPMGMMASSEVAQGIYNMATVAGALSPAQKAEMVQKYMAHQVNKGALVEGSPTHQYGQQVVEHLNAEQQKADLAQEPPALVLKTPQEAGLGKIAAAYTLHQIATAKGKTAAERAQMLKNYVDLGGMTGATESYAKSLIRGLGGTVEEPEEPAEPAEPEYEEEGQYFPELTPEPTFPEGTTGADIPAPPSPGTTANLIESWAKSELPLAVKLNKIEGLGDIGGISGQYQQQVLSILKGEAKPEAAPEDAGAIGNLIDKYAAGQLPAEEKVKFIGQMVLDPDANAAAQAKAKAVLEGLAQIHPQHADLVQEKIDAIDEAMAHPGLTKVGESWVPKPFSATSKEMLESATMAASTKNKITQLHADIANATDPADKEYGQNLLEALGEGAEPAVPEPKSPAEEHLKKVFEGTADPPVGKTKAEYLKLVAESSSNQSTASYASALHTLAAAAEPAPAAPGMGPTVFTPAPGALKPIPLVNHPHLGTAEIPPPPANNPVAVKAYQILANPAEPSDVKYGKLKSLQINAGVEANAYIEKAKDLIGPMSAQAIFGASEELEPTPAPAAVGIPAPPPLTGLPASQNKANLIHQIATGEGDVQSKLNQINQITTVSGELTQYKNQVSQALKGAAAAAGTPVPPAPPAQPPASHEMYFQKPSAASLKQKMLYAVASKQGMWPEDTAALLQKRLQYYLNQGAIKPNGLVHKYGLKLISSANWYAKKFPKPAGAGAPGGVALTPQAAPKVSMVAGVPAPANEAQKSMHSVASAGPTAAAALTKLEEAATHTQDPDNLAHLNQIIAAKMKEVMASVPAAPLSPSGSPGTKVTAMEAAAKDPANATLAQKIAAVEAVESSQNYANEYKKDLLDYLKGQPKQAPAAPAAKPPPGAPSPGTMAAQIAKTAPKESLTAKPGTTVYQARKGSVDLMMSLKREKEAANPASTSSPESYQIVPSMNSAFWQKVSHSKDAHAIESYGGGGYGGINGVLRFDKTPSPSELEKIDAMRALFHDPDVATTADINLVRGEDVDQKTIQDLLGKLAKGVGSVPYQRTGFTSASIGKEPGYRASANTWWHFTVKKGTPVLGIAGKVGHHEREVLMDHAIGTQVYEMYQEAHPKYGMQWHIKATVG